MYAMLTSHAELLLLLQQSKSEVRCLAGCPQFLRTGRNIYGAFCKRSLLSERRGLTVKTPSASSFFFEGLLLFTTACPYCFPFPLRLFVNETLWLFLMDKLGGALTISAWREKDFGFVN